MTGGVIYASDTGNKYVRIRDRFCIKGPNPSFFQDFKFCDIVEA